MDVAKSSVLMSLLKESSRLTTTRDREGAGRQERGLLRHMVHHCSDKSYLGRELALHLGLMHQPYQTNRKLAVPPENAIA